jgi:hypothetical protein
VKIASYLLNVIFLALIAGYFLFFHNPQSKEQESLNAAWLQFSSDVGELGQLVEDAPFNQNQKTAADGYRHMARFLSSFVATFTDFRNPGYPQFTRFPNNVARIGWDNPDNPYLSFHVRGDHSYRLRGNVKNFDLVTFNVYSGMLGYHPMSEIRTVSSITSEELAVDENGDFELILSGERQDGNWLKLDPDAYMVVVRRLVSDWEQTDEGLWEIVNLNTLGTSAPRVTTEDVTTQLRESVKMAAGVRKTLTLAHRALFQLKQSPNEVPQPQVGDSNLPMADPFQAATRAWFQLAEDEVLVITAPEMNCKFTNIQLANPWMESLDYASRQSSLNHSMVHVDDDRRIRYVISQRDPGIQNWLDTGGYAEGSLFARWTYCETYPTELESSVVKLAELLSLLPENTPRVSPEERAATIAMRQAAISRRYAGGS